VKTSVLLPTAILLLLAVLNPSAAYAGDDLYKQGAKKCGPPPATTQSSPVTQPFYHLNSPQEVFISDDGSRVMTSDYYRIGVWRLPDWTPIYAFRSPIQQMSGNPGVFNQGLGSALVLRQGGNVWDTINHGLSADGTVTAFTAKQSECTDIYGNGNYLGSVHGMEALGFHDNQLVLQEKKKTTVKGLYLLNPQTGTTGEKVLGKTKNIDSAFLAEGRFVYLHRKEDPESVLVDLADNSVNATEIPFSETTREYEHFRLSGHLILWKESVSFSEKKDMAWDMTTRALVPNFSTELKPDIPEDEYSKHDLKRVLPGGQLIYIHAGQAWLYDLASGALLTPIPLPLSRGINTFALDKLTPLPGDTWTLLDAGDFSSNKDGLNAVGPAWSLANDFSAPPFYPPLKSIEQQIAKQKAARDAARAQFSDVPTIQGEWQLQEKWPAVNITRRQVASGLPGNVYALGRKGQLILGVIATEASVDLVLIRNQGSQFDYQRLRDALPASRRSYSGVEDIAWHADGSVTGKAWYADQATLDFRVEMKALGNPWVTVTPGTYIPPRRMSWSEYEAFMSSGANCKRVMIYHQGEVRQDCVSEEYFNQYLKP